MDIVTGYRQQAIACTRAAQSARDGRTRALWLEESRLWITLAVESETTDALVRAIARDAGRACSLVES